MDLITDEASELVLGLEVRAGNAGDGEGAIPLLDQVQARPGVALDTLVGDMAYSDGDLRAGVEERGVELVAKVPPVTNGGRYPKTDFYVDLRRRRGHLPGRGGHHRRHPQPRPQGPARSAVPLRPRRVRHLPPAGRLHHRGRRTDHLCRRPPPAHRSRPSRPAEHSSEKDQPFRLKVTSCSG